MAGLGGEGRDGEWERRGVWAEGLEGWSGKRYEVFALETGAVLPI